MTQRCVCLILLSASSVSAVAAPYSYITWDTSTQTATSIHGSIPSDLGSIGVDLTGNFSSISTNYPSWSPASTFSDGVIVDNAPSTTMMVRVDVAGEYRLSFSQPVQNVAFSVWSVGQGGVPITYTFDQTPILVSGGPSAEYGGSSITLNGNAVTGVEGNGTVLFAGPFSTLSWSIAGNETFHGFTLGLSHHQVVPEPTSMLALSVGALALVRRKGRR